MIITGNCLEVIKSLEVGSIDAIVSDPPYGMNWNTNSKRFTGGNMKRGDGRDWPKILNDDKPFDPTMWLSWKKVLLFGSNHFANKLPVGTTLIWIKKNEEAYGTFLSDAELAWMKGGHGCYCFKAMSDRNYRKGAHPTQKPISLMQWCIRKLKLNPGATILDPYCGSGSTGVAAIREGFNFIGIEMEPQYAELAKRRIETERQKTSLLELIK